MGQKNKPTHPNDSDIDVNMVNKQNVMTDNQRNVNNRITKNQAVNPDIAIPRKRFRNFSATHSNKATNI